MVPTPAREPFASPHGPAPERTNGYYAHRNAGIIQSPCGDRIDNRQAKRYRNENNPDARYYSYWFASFTEVERAAFVFGPN